MEKPERWLIRIRVIYLVTTALLVALTIYSFIEVKNLLASSDRVGHTYEINLSLAKISNAVSEVETNQKNFLLTGNSACLAKRDAAIVTMNEELSRVDSLTRDNPEQTENLNVLHTAIGQKLANMQQVQKAHTTPALRPELKKTIAKGIEHTDTIKGVVDKLAQNENALLKQQTESYLHLAVITPLVTAVLFISSLVILLISYYKIISEYRKTRKLEAIVVANDAKISETLTSKKLLEESEQKYKELNQTLEEKVKERTTKLEEINLTLKQSEERYHRMIEEVQDYAIILLSREGIIENWNKGAENIKGYTAKEIVGKSFSTFYTPDDRANGLPDKLLKLAKENGKATDENWRVRKDGTRFWGSVVITALHDNAGNITGFVKVTRDLTQRKIAEEEIRAKAEQLEASNIQLEKMNKELQSFAYISSHDLQEPLRKIQTFASRILDKEHDTLSESGKDSFRRMQTSAQRMQVLIQDLLAYSRTSTSERTFETTHLNTIVREVLEELKEELESNRATIHVPELGTLDVIPFQFRQLMFNLIGNSLKFSYPGRPVVIDIKCEVANGIQFKNEKLLPHKKYCHISVTDNGIGFDQEYSDRIFEVFQRLHGKSEYKGTGIGLSIVKKIVENHDGVITASGRLNQGSTFDIYLPVN